MFKWRAVQRKKDSSKYLVAYSCHGVGFGDLETARGTEGELAGVCLPFVCLVVVCSEATQRRGDTTAPAACAQPAPLVLLD